MTALSTDALLAVANRLAGNEITHIALAASGGNSRIYRTEADSKTYALKYYAPTAPGTRNRMEAEVAALQFFFRHRLPHVPHVYGSEDRFALYDWMEGSIATARITLADVDEAASFLGHFPTLSQATEAASFGYAAEACLSLDELLAQIDRRLIRLREIAPDHPALHAFLTGDFSAAYAHARTHAESTWRTHGWPSARELPYSERCLVPGDFGFHNALKNDDGSLNFIDFEYFGWDDPVKLVADTMLHPGYQLSPEALERLHSRLVKLFSHYEAFAIRLAALLPLFSLRWALILCNEFLQEKRVNRAFAADIAESDASEWARRQQVQLAKATAMLVHPALAATHA